MPNNSIHNEVRELNKKYCSYCGKPITDNFLRIGDSFLVVNYFDTAADNLFCSEHCLVCSLSTFEITQEGEEIPLA